MDIAKLRGLLDKIAADNLSMSVASCTCLTKSPDGGLHKPSCRYRKLREQEASIQEAIGILSAA